MSEWPAKAEPFHDARDDEAIYLSPEEIEVFLVGFRKTRVEPPPQPDPAAVDEEDEQ